MVGTIINGLKVSNELLTAGIAIIGFSLLVYAMSFNLRDRVARSFAFILMCVVVVSVGDAISGQLTSRSGIEFWMRVQWVGILFLPPAYLHFSDALLETTGRPSRGRRRRLVRAGYLVSAGFALTLFTPWLVGPLILDTGPAPHLERNWLAWIFTAYYLAMIAFAIVNVWRAYRRTVTRTSRRRMRYLLLGSLAPVLGTYPFLLFGSGFAANHPLFFWLAANLSNLLVSFLLVVMAYAVAFFGVAWPDRVVKRRLFKWLMRGPVTAFCVLAMTTGVRWVNESLGNLYPAAIPIVMIASLLIIEHLITLLAPLWERWLFHGGDPGKLLLIQSLEERMLTSGDLRDFLESILAALCDRLQVTNAFIVVLGSNGAEMLLTLGNKDPFADENNQLELIQTVSKNGGVGVRRAGEYPLLTWKNYWLIPLFSNEREVNEENLMEQLSGFLGVEQKVEHDLDSDQLAATRILARRAALALEDVKMQQQVFASVEALTPQVEQFQRLRAAARYDGTDVLTSADAPLDDRDMSRWVKDALSHYWGGPKLSQSPLLRLEVVKRALEENGGNPTNALRSILQQAIERVRPEGERRFTGEWILYNILDLKFMEGRKVREIALRLAMSEADLYRKQRVAIEAVARAIVTMEAEARKEVWSKSKVIHKERESSRATG
jgi:hypothetical protein